MKIGNWIFDEDGQQIIGSGTNAYLTRVRLLNGAWLVTPLGI